MSSHTLHLQVPRLAGEVHCVKFRGINKVSLVEGLFKPAKAGLGKSLARVLPTECNALWRVATLNNALYL